MGLCLPCLGFHTIYSGVSKTWQRFFLDTCESRSESAELERVESSEAAAKERENSEQQRLGWRRPMYFSLVCHIMAMVGVFPLGVRDGSGRAGEQNATPQITSPQRKKPGKL